MQMRKLSWLWFVTCLLPRSATVSLLVSPPGSFVVVITAERQVASGSVSWVTKVTFKALGFATLSDERINTRSWKCYYLILQYFRMVPNRGVVFFFLNGIHTGFGSSILEQSYYIRLELLTLKISHWIIKSAALVVSQSPATCPILW